MSEFNIFTPQVGDALPILEQMGYEVTVFKVTWGLAAQGSSPVEVDWWVGPYVAAEN